MGKINTCKDVKNYFTENYANCSLSSFRSSDKKHIKIKRNCQNRIFDGDKVISKNKSPDYIAFLWYQDDKRTIYLRVIEIHKPRLTEVVAKKKSFETFWKNNIGGNVNEICQSYKFILIKRGKQGIRRAYDEIRMRGIIVSEKYTLP